MHLIVGRRLPRTRARPIRGPFISSLAASENADYNQTCKDRTSIPWENGLNLEQEKIL